ncbi:Soluble inorganic pyrophosphatase 6, chloroplastic [Sesamum angolense]|uniref:inorganic diphosphatase n=1 Tax=Sesamum angolense TaxID=2727404 RepID=A0AAE1T3D9_9LAMI|nr:Soluble inorganic pyrophosphatase 6, chloroplastic [Sesamum angolense]
MAATRVMASASSAFSGTVLTRSPLRGKPQSLSICFRNNRVLAQRRRLFTCTAIYNPQVQTREEGQPETLDYRVFFVLRKGRKIGKNIVFVLLNVQIPISPWHDVPLHLGDGVFNFIVEIPKESSAKMEVATDEHFTPIKQDTKKGKLRYYPYNINWNYGLLPQTWEDPSLANAEVEGLLETMIQA